MKKKAHTQPLPRSIYILLSCVLVANIIVTYVMIRYFVFI